MAACLRGISKRVNLFQRRIFPTCGHLLGDDKDTLTQKILACNGSYKLSPMFVERHYQSLAGPLGLGFSSCRYMSSTPPERSDKVDGIDFVATEVVPDAVIEAVTTSHAVPAVNEVAIAAADSAFPVAALQYLIDGVHSFTGLNWWASIALTTVIIRGVTVPLRLNQLKDTYKIVLLKPQLEELIRAMSTYKTMDRETMDEVQRQGARLFSKEHGLAPLSVLKRHIIQGSIFISFFFAIRNMAEKVPSFKTGGTLWFTDLTTADTTHILPLLTAATFLIKPYLKEAHPIAGSTKKFSRSIAFLSIPVTIGFENAMFCYLLTSSLLTHLFRLAIGHPRVMRLLYLFISTTGQPEPKDQSVAQETPMPSSKSSSSVPDRRIPRSSVQRTRENKK